MSVTPNPLHDTLMMHRDFWTVVLSSFIGQQLKLLLSVLKLCCSISQLACMLLVKELLQVWAGRAFSAAGGFVRLLSSSVNMWGGCPLELPARDTPPADPMRSARPLRLKCTWASALCSEA